MERIKKLAEEMRSKPIPSTDEEVVNAVREYLQVLILKLIYQSKYGAALSFMGGTCLRICYDLKRYSEDLDFALDGDDHRKRAYRFSALADLLKKELDLLGYEVSSKAHEDKIVQKAFISFSKLPEALGLRRMRKEQKIHIKIEVDVRPVSLKKKERESFFISRFQEIFPVLKHTLPTLFAGKILAILCRPYTRGRDYYDLIWYLSRKTELDLGYLNRGMKKETFKNEKEVFETLGQKIRAIRPEFILKDISRFLEDPKEADWISRYQEIFDQFSNRYLI